MFLIEYEKETVVEFQYPYLLFLGDARDQLAAKTANGVRVWRPDWCLGQFRFEDFRPQDFFWGAMSKLGNFCIGDLWVAHAL